MNTAPRHGLLAEFEDAGQLLAAVERVRHENQYALVEVYSPFAVPGMEDALGLRPNHVPFAMLCGAVIFGGGLYALEWFSAAVDYPLNIGGRPPFSWPAFLPPALEMTLLGAALFGVLALLFACRLPRVRHPLFAVHAFERATSDRFFLWLGAGDPRFELASARKLLERLSPISIHEVAE